MLLPSIDAFYDLVRRSLNTPNLGLPMPRNRPNRGIEFLRGGALGNPLAPQQPVDPNLLRRGAETVLGLAFGIPEAYDRAGRVMDRSRHLPAAISRAVSEQPELYAGYGLSSILTPGPDDPQGFNSRMWDMIRHDSIAQGKHLDDFIGNYPWSADRMPQGSEGLLERSAARRAAGAELQRASRRVHRREATVQRRLVEGYEGKATPLGFPGEDILHPTVGPDWAESPGDYAARLPHRSTEDLAQTLKESFRPGFLKPDLYDGPSPDQLVRDDFMRWQAVRQELNRRGWRGDISDVEHLALEGPAGPLDFGRRGPKSIREDQFVRKNPQLGPTPFIETQPWTREERGGEMLNKLINDDAEATMDSGYRPGTFDELAYVNPDYDIQYNTPSDKTPPNFVTKWLDNVDKAKSKLNLGSKGNSMYMWGKRYMRGKRGWMHDPTYEAVYDRKIVGNQTLLPRPSKEIDANIEHAVGNNSDVPAVVDLLNQHVGAPRDIAEFWVARHIMRRMASREATPEQVTWFNLWAMQRNKPNP